MDRHRAVVTCRQCGLPNPPATATCTFDHYHFVGFEAGCRGCGRLREACTESPCWGAKHPVRFRLRQLRMWLRGLGT